MYRSGYNKVLTITIIILIVAIIIIASILGIKALVNRNEKKEKERVLAQLEERAFEPENKVEEDNETSEEETGTSSYIPIADINQTENNSGNGGGGSSTRKKAVMYKSYPVAGYIKISKINLEYPILLDSSPGALDTSICVSYPNNPKLNQPGIVVLIGHNYENGKFFAKNEQLAVGDKIEITDADGGKRTYKIYEVFQTTEYDTEYITRDRGDSIDIALSTCTDDGNNRLVILARAE